MKTIWKISVVFLLTACSSRESKNTNTVESIEPPAMKTDFTLVGDTVIIPEFEIQLSVSQKAEEKLKNDGESIIVQAYFSGVPRDTTSEEYLESGQISIGGSRVELFDKRIARFQNVKIARSKLDEITDKNFEVLINIFSGRRTTGNNLLDSDLLQEGIESVKGKRHVLKTKLIYGE